MSPPAREVQPPPQTERDLLEWLRSQPETAGYIGDDAAILRSGPVQAVTVDSQIAGTHVPHDIEAGSFGRRLLAVNLSDIAAMGARPRFGFLALAAPPDFSRIEFFKAFLAACEPVGVTLAGGDLCGSALLSATLMVLGETWPGSHWLRRSDGSPGQSLWVGGTLGEAALGCRLARMGGRLDNRIARLPASAAIPPALEHCAERALQRHFEPSPQLDLGRWLAGQRAAATDISDGLARDLHHLCESSDMGAEVQEDRLPCPGGFADLSHHLELDPLTLMLAGGEDYVLLFTLPQGVVPPPELGCHQIGCTTPPGKVSLCDRKGIGQPLGDLGWDHFPPQPEPEPEPG